MTRTVKGAVKGRGRADPRRAPRVAQVADGIKSIQIKGVGFRGRSTYGILESWTAQSLSRVRGVEGKIRGNFAAGLGVVATR